MEQTALLLLTGPLRLVVESIGQFLNNANKRVLKRLYVKLEPDFSIPFSKKDTETIKKFSSVVPVVYNKASSICKSVDVRVLLTNVQYSRSDTCPKLNFDVIMSNSGDEDKVLNSYVGRYFNNDSFSVIKLDNVDFNTAKDESVTQSPEYKVYNTVCLGGTFDRLHNGHKVLLSEAVLRTKDKLIVGVSDIQMIKKKVLWELIEPLEKRIDEVSKFLSDVDPSIYCDVVPISDPFGPTITDPNIDCIVVTTETRIGGDKVNIERKNKNMHELSMVVVNLVENCERSSHEEEKVSSSTNRMHLLGTPLQPTQVIALQKGPYCILFRGHLMSGKSFIASRFQSFGLPVLCCDEILRAIINKDDSLQEKVREKVPNDSSTGFDFDKLALHCLKNKEDKKWFAELVQSKVKSSLHQVLKVYSEQGARVVLVKDSTILEGYDLEIDVNEIWASILPANENMKKLKELYKVTDEETSEIINCLPSNEQYVKTANILFCNMWSTEAIQAQVDRAWSYVTSIKNSILPSTL